MQVFFCVHKLPEFIYLTEVHVIKLCSRNFFPSVNILSLKYFRWQPTRAPNPWEGILQATSHGPVCPQRFPVDMRSEKDQADALLRMPKQRLRQLQLLRSQLLRQSEDCLYLNIFVPLKVEKSANARKRGKFFGDF